MSETRNRYAPPAAEVADAQLEGVQEELIPNGRFVPVGNGVRWLSEAMRLYFQQPLMWTGVLVLLILLLIIAAFIPFSNLLTTALWPVVGGGMMLALRLQRQTGSFTINHVFAGFGPRFVPLAIVGSTLLLMYPIMLLSIAFFLGADTAQAMALGGSNIDPMQLMTRNFWLAILVYLLLAVPIGAAAYLAPPLIMLHGVPAGTAMKMSFIACIKNMLAGIVFGLVMIVVMVVSIIPLGLGLLASIPIGMISTYTMYRDIFVAEA